MMKQNKALFQNFINTSGMLLRVKLLAGGDLMNVKISNSENRTLQAQARRVSIRL